MCYAHLDTKLPHNDENIYSGVDLAKAEVHSGLRASAFGQDYPVYVESPGIDRAASAPTQTGFDRYSSSPTPAGRRMSAGVPRGRGTLRASHPAETRVTGEEPFPHGPFVRTFATMSCVQAFR